MRHPRRPGLSLTEVLVALFVMALGLMALLTLFPLGAMQVGQALKDDRTAQTAQQADAWVRVYWRDAIAAYAGNPDALPTETALAAFDDPNVDGTGTWTNGTSPFTTFFQAAATASNGTPTLLPGGSTLGNSVGNDFVVTPSGRVSLVQASVQNTTSNLAATNTQRFVSISSRTSGASYPVLLDPLGYLARSSSLQFEKSWVGYNSTGNTPGVYGVAPAATPMLLPRRNTLVTPGRDTAFAACSLTDDLTYQPNGGTGQSVTDPNTGLAVTQPLGRQGRYTWAAMLQRPDNARPDQASLRVMVFDGRPPFLGVAGDEVVLVNDTSVTPNVVFHQNVTAGSRSVFLNVPTRGSDQPPLVRRGGWIVVASMDAPGVPNGTRGVSFHRITGLTTLDEENVSRFSGQPASTAVTPVALDIDPPIPGQVSANPQVILFAGLSEVFDRIPLSGN